MGWEWGRFRPSVARRQTNMERLSPASARNSPHLTLDPPPEIAHWPRSRKRKAAQKARVHRIPFHRPDLESASPAPWLAELGPQLCPKLAKLVHNLSIPGETWAKLRSSSPKVGQIRKTAETERGPGFEFVRIVSKPKDVDRSMFGFGLAPAQFVRIEQVEDNVPSKGWPTTEKTTTNVSSTCAIQPLSGYPIHDMGKLPTKCSPRVPGSYPRRSGDRRLWPQSCPNVVEKLPREPGQFWANFGAILGRS